MSSPDSLLTTLETGLDAIAESYVKLVLALGEHDADYVDAFYGPAHWREQAKAAKLPLQRIRDSAHRLLERLHNIVVDGPNEMLLMRKCHLTKQVQAMIARIGMLSGKSLSFEEEALALYDARPPTYGEENFKEILRELKTLLPGSGSVSERYEQFRNSFTIPSDRLDGVFQAAITECRKRAKDHLELPEQESFSLEYVRNKSWSGYNWYKGDSRSLIQINTDLPIHIDRAIDLAAHEGYPGHHVYNTLLEKHLARERNWVEFTVYALFSPQSLIAEGTANFGIEVAFPGEQRVKFEQDVLFPLAGFNADRAEQYYRIHRLVSRLNYAHNEAARRYLDGAITREQAEEFLVSYALMSPERARQRVRFIDTYRSYVINYNLGQDLVKRYVESRGGTSDQPERRWEEFKPLLSSPLVPSDLV